MKILSPKYNWKGNSVERKKKTLHQHPWVKAKDQKFLICSIDQWLVFLSLLRVNSHADRNMASSSLRTLKIHGRSSITVKAHTCTYTLKTSQYLYFVWDKKDDLSSSSRSNLNERGSSSGCCESRTFRPSDLTSAGAQGGEGDLSQLMTRWDTPGKGLETLVKGISMLRPPHSSHRHTFPPLPPL